MHEALGPWSVGPRSSPTETKLAEGRSQMLLQSPVGGSIKARRPCPYLTLNR